MPGSAWVFRRDSESIIITRQSLPTGTLLVMIGPDGVPRSRSFPAIEDAMVYHLQLESALVASGWLLQEIVAPEQPIATAVSPATVH